MDPLSIVMILAVVVLIFFMFRNGKKRQQAQQELRESMRPGVEVMLGSGIYGTIISVDEEKNRATIESGNTTLEVHMQAISQVVPEAVVPADEEPVVAPDDDPEFGERIDAVETEDTAAPSDNSGQSTEEQIDDLDAPSNDDSETGTNGPDANEAR